MRKDRGIRQFLFDKLYVTVKTVEMISSFSKVRRIWHISYRVSYVSNDKSDSAKYLLYASRVEVERGSEQLSWREERGAGEGIHLCEKCVTAGQSNGEWSRMHIPLHH